MTTRNLIIALTTVADEAAADELATTLVTERLAACVNRVAVVSTYRWQGAVETQGEILLIIKSTNDLVARLRDRVHALHAYEVPEFVVIEPGEVGAAYLAWALAACELAAE